MLRRSAALLTCALGVVAALASGSAEASRPSAPDVVGVQAGAFSAVVKWRVDEPVRIVVEVGTDDRYGIWSPTTVVHRADTRKVLCAWQPAGTTARPTLSP